MSTCFLRTWLVVLRSRVAVSLAIAVVVACAACQHSTPFAGETPPTSDGAFSVGAPVRFTFDNGMDQVGSFSADGTMLLYAFQPKLPLPPLVPARPDVDRCIGLLPANGGTRREICRDDFAGLDSSDAFEHAALGADGTLLYGAYSAPIRGLLTSSGTLRAGSLSQPYPGRILLTTPTVTAGLSFDHFGVIRWASPTTFFVQVLDQTLIGNPYNEVKSDTLQLGIGILRGDLSATGVVFTAVAGADSASGFDLSIAGDSLYFTRLDDASLYVVAGTGGTRRVVYSLASAAPRTILRDPTRVGGRIAVVRQDYQQRATLKFPDPPWGLAPGSRIELVRPSDGTATLLASATGNRNSEGALAAFGALLGSPDGCRLVVEHRIVQGFTYTTDLYSYCLGPAGQCSCG